MEIFNLLEEYKICKVIVNIYPLTSEQSLQLPIIFEKDE